MKLCGLFMNELSIFQSINTSELETILKKLGARKITFKKDHIIFSNLVENDLIAIVLNGIANIIKYDYSGNRNIIDSLEYDDIFGKPFSYANSDMSVIAASDCEILFLDYSLLKDNQEEYQKINENINNIITNKINKLYEKVELLTKRTIKDKLLCYFEMIVQKKGKKTFVLPITYLELADYLAVDRSAMMREIKKLKDQKIILVNGKKISLNY